MSKTETIFLLILIVLVSIVSFKTGELVGRHRLTETFTVMTSQWVPCGSLKIGQEIELRGKDMLGNYLLRYNTSGGRGTECESGATFYLTEGELLETINRNSISPH